MNESCYSAVPHFAGGTGIPKKSSTTFSSISAIYVHGIGNEITVIAWYFRGLGKLLIFEDIFNQIGLWTSRVRPPAVVSKNTYLLQVNKALLFLSLCIHFPSSMSHEYPIFQHLLRADNGDQIKTPANGSTSDCDTTRRKALNQRHAPPFFQAFFPGKVWSQTEMFGKLCHNGRCKNEKKKKTQNTAIT